MIIVEVAFVLVNLVVPYWIWTSKQDSALPQIDHSVLKKSLGDLSQAAGGFSSCNIRAAVEAMDEICEQSRRSWSEKGAAPFRRLGRNVTFTCKITSEEIRVQWVNDKPPVADLDCHILRPQMLRFAPTFVLGLKGRLRRVEYLADDGSEQSISFLNCRLKMKQAQQLSPVPPSRQDFLTAIGKGTSDPPDYLLGNLICLSFDPHAGWANYRRRFSNGEI